MVDWPGLLKFSLTHTDGTHKSNFQEMDPERKKWLEEAINHYTMAEVRRIQQLLEELRKPELDTEEDYKRCSSMLEEMEELIESLDRGQTLYQLGGQYTILNIIFNSKDTNCRVIAARVFCFANQNDAKVQNESIAVGAFEFVQRISKEKDVQVKESFLSCVSSLIRGENLEAKRIFIRIKGLEMIREVLSDQPTQRMKSKCFNILRDLLFYDEKLHHTYNDLSSFTNTNSIKVAQKDTNLEFDPNKTVVNNELPENAQFKGLVKKWLTDNAPIQAFYEATLKEEQA